MPSADNRSDNGDAQQSIGDKDKAGERAAKSKSSSGKCTSTRSFILFYGDLGNTNASVVRLFCWNALCVCQVVARMPCTASRGSGYGVRGSAERVHDQFSTRMRRSPNFQSQVPFRSFRLIKPFTRQLKTSRTSLANFSASARALQVPHAPSPIRHSSRARPRTPAHGS
jgi:hypothetical protein